MALRIAQVGVVRVGQPFPFWVRSQMQIILKVSAAVPADLVRLVAGAEVAVAPQPRSRPHMSDSRFLAPSEAAVDGGEETGESAQRVVWLRIQVCVEVVRLPLQCRLRCSTCVNIADCEVVFYPPIVVCLCRMAMRWEL